ncbi:MAG TPA: hypothetical protein VHB74_10625 [Devosia sp.]|nr:hypothetical protein [Devosia sp.]
MKSIVIAAALVAAFGISAPVTVEAKALSSLTDTQIYCSIFPYAAKCAAAKPAATAKKPVAKLAAKPGVKLVAAAKPAVKVAFKTLHCVKAAPKAGHLYDCTWK